MGKMKNLHYELWNCYSDMTDTINIVGEKLFLMEMPQHLKEAIYREYVLKIEYEILKQQYSVQKVISEDNRKDYNGVW